MMPRSSSVPRENHWRPVEVGFIANEAKGCKKAEGNSWMLPWKLILYTTVNFGIEGSGNLCWVSVFVLLWALRPSAFAFCVCGMELLRSENNGDARTVITSTAGQTWHETIFYAEFEWYSGKKEKQNPLNSCPSAKVPEAPGERSKEPLPNPVS